MVGVEAINSSPESPETKAQRIAKKSDIIYRAIYQLQPDFKDFKGFEGYPNWLLKQDSNSLMERYRQQGLKSSGNAAANDRWSKQAEPILTYLLSSGILPTRESFAHLATEYDDKFNGTDIVFGVRSQDKSRFVVFSIDVATGTDQKNIIHKFEESGKPHKKTPPFAAHIKYCKHLNKRWEELTAPHFVLGMMPARIDDVVDEIQIDDEGIIKGREVNPNQKPSQMADFRILSELYEQIRMQKLFLKRTAKSDSSSEKRLRDLEDLRRAVIFRLCDILGIDITLPKETKKIIFDKKYPEEVEAAKRKDSVYENIINVVKEINRQITEKNGGNKA